MEHSLSSHAFKGSIMEAITEAKQQKKLFVVYLAGDNLESKDLETSTWTDPNVSEVLTKYCILLHILEGSSEASQFSAIYFLKLNFLDLKIRRSVRPEIYLLLSLHAIQIHRILALPLLQLGTMVYNFGRQGFAAAEVVASSLEKAWLSLHVQETTAAFLTAALASKQDLTSHTSERVPSEQGTSGIDEPSSTDVKVPSQIAGHLNSEIIEERNSRGDVHKEAGHGKKSEDLQGPDATVPNSGVLIESKSKTAEKTPLDPQEIGQNSAPGETSSLSDSHSHSINETSVEIVKKTSDSQALKVAEKITKDEDVHTSDSSATKSNDVFLNIRVPDGSSLQVKFTVMDTLRMVKDYVSDNLTSNFGSFDLATPYPRKVFHDQELDSTLSALGLINRQALILVSHKEKSSSYMGGSSPNVSGSSNENAGYWASVRRILSYANPFSYFSSANPGSTSTSQQSQAGMWQYSPNPSLQNNLRGAGTPPATESSQGQSGPANARKSRLLNSQFGSNIHTLKHDEDDERSSDRNTFWNGNSTEFGGNGDGK